MFNVSTMNLNCRKRGKVKANCDTNNQIEPDMNQYVAIVTPKMDTMDEAESSGNICQTIQTGANDIYIYICTFVLQNPMFIVVAHSGTNHTSYIPLFLLKQFKKNCVKNN